MHDVEFVTTPHHFHSLKLVSLQEAKLAMECVDISFLALRKNNNYDRCFGGSRKEARLLRCQQNKGVSATSLGEWENSGLR